MKRCSKGFGDAPPTSRKGGSGALFALLAKDDFDPIDMQTDVCYTVSSKTQKFTKFFLIDRTFSAWKIVYNIWKPLKGNSVGKKEICMTKFKRSKDGILVNLGLSGGTRSPDRRRFSEWGIWLYEQY